MLILSSRRNALMRFIARKVILYASSLLVSLATLANCQSRADSHSRVHDSVSFRNAFHPRNGSSEKSLTSSLERPPATCNHPGAHRDPGKHALSKHSKKPQNPKPDPQPPAWWPKTIHRKIEAENSADRVKGRAEWNGNDVWRRLNPVTRKKITNVEQLILLLDGVGLPPPKK